LTKTKTFFQRKGVKLSIRVLITLVLFIVLIYTIGIGNVIDALIHVKFPPLLVAWAFGLFSHYLEASQMKRLMKEADMEISTLRAFLAGSLSALYGLIIPGDSLASVAKWADLSAAVGEKSGVLNSILYRRLMRLMPEIVVGLIAFAIHNPTDNPLIPAILGIVSVLILVISIYFYHPRTGPKINNLMGKVSTSILPKSISSRIEHVLASLESFYVFSWQFHLKMFLRSLMIILVGYVSFYFAAISAGIDLSIIVLLWVKSIILIARQLPISISGLGVRESILVAVLTPFGVVDVAAFSLGIISFTNNIIYGLIGAGYQISLTFGWVKWRSNIKIDGSGVAGSDPSLQNHERE